MNKLFVALSFSVIGNLIAWFHMNAQFRWEWARTHWWIALGGLPVGYLFYYSTRMFYEYFGEYWTVRPIGFGIATMTFTLMTALVLHEVPSQRIIVSLILACVILYINLSVHIK
ncbi:hypothetical protein HOE22_10880 [Candidatus Woesearchaeota archaeon]|nr:hypothetical protein [Candidatus Woesearchaeota archaeon]MBT4732575.1 hypothetical protein [Candidatus Woesearchaeota archaeon]MBT7558767.1 hypothetical protein [Candidatus Woesearchaeota archaeon]